MPALVPRGEGQQLVGLAGRGLYAYDPETGKELWHVRHRGWSVAPRPVSGHGLVFATVDRDRPELWAIRLDGNGDVTDTHIKWKSIRSMPQRCSPLLVGDLLFVVNRGGIATCLEARTGEVVLEGTTEGRVLGIANLRQGTDLPVQRGWAYHGDTAGPQARSHRQQRPGQAAVHGDAGGGRGRVHHAHRRTPVSGRGGQVA